LRALQYAKDTKLTTIGFSGYDGGPMKDLVETCVVVPANSTPHVEAFHVVLTHLITFGLKQKINQESKIIAKSKTIKNGSVKVSKK
jgi:D-sedoheptulose 7-phosphate isomerase